MFWCILWVFYVVTDPPPIPTPLPAHMEIWHIVGHFKKQMWSQHVLDITYTVPRVHQSKCYQSSQTGPIFTGHKMGHNSVQVTHMAPILNMMNQHTKFQFDAIFVS